MAGGDDAQEAATAANVAAVADPSTMTPASAVTTDSVELSDTNQETPTPTDEAVPPTATTRPADASTQVAAALKTITASVEVENELQCTLCHELLCKPVSIPCGHSFCRVCLLDFLLSREIDDSQCPICRGVVLSVASPLGNDATPTFNVNVTLWNLIQMLVPVGRRSADDGNEDDEYALKYDEFDAKWRIAVLQRSAGDERQPIRGRRRPANNHSDIDTSSDDENDGGGLDEETLLQRRTRYPELHVDNVTQDGLQLSRNVVLDHEDANIDGYRSMRIGLAIMEFPSVFQLYNEHQECSIAVIKFEEDEDMDGGMPLFLSDEGVDDDFIISDHYDEITLQVIDDGGNVVLERQRGARQGVVTFPQLRLDVPGGVYKFRFTDDVFGVFLEIETRLREPQEEHDTLLEEERVASFIQDQASERSRGRRGRQGFSDDEFEDDHPNSSDDSFIVDDFEVEEDGHFSGSEEDEEAVMEQVERRRRQRRAVRDDEGAHWEDDDDDAYNTVDDTAANEDSDDQLDELVSRPPASRRRIIDDDHSDASNADHEAAPASASVNSDRGKKRSRTIIGSDDAEDPSDEEETEEQDVTNGLEVDTTCQSDDSGARHGYPSKRLRQVTLRIFHDDEDDDGEGDDDAQDHDAGDDDIDGDGGDDDDTGRARWIGSDPFWPRQSRSRNGDQDAADEDENDESDGQPYRTIQLYVNHQRPPRLHGQFEDEVEDEVAFSDHDDDDQDHEDPWDGQDHDDFDAEDDANYSDF